MSALILVTNDDGISAPGLWRLAEGLLRLGEVVVVGSERDASGSGAALALRGPIACRRVEGPARAFAVDATPATCVWAGVAALLHRKPDLVVSGINIGPNLGRDVLISGTAGAALFAGSQGIPALAVSTDLHPEPDWRAPVAVAEQVLRLRFRQPLVLNMNVPAGARVRGAELTALSQFTHLDMVSVDLRYEGDRLQLFPTMNLRRPDRIQEGTDLTAYARGHASLTILEPKLPEGEVVSHVKRIAAQIGGGLDQEAGD